ncbi:MAG: GWxTD domain-containing protein [Chlorobiota bacterium]
MPQTTSSTVLQRIFEALVFLCGLSFQAIAQEIQPLVDVLCFAAENADSNARVDVWTIVPYAALSFRPADTAGFRASYTLSVVIHDSLRAIPRTHRYVRRVAAPSYAVAQGATAGFDYVQTVEHLPPGTYTITVTVTDNATEQTYSSARRYTVPDYRLPEVALSSIVLASSVESRSDRPVVTPFFADNLTQLEDPPFAILEAYAKVPQSKLTVTAELLTPAAKPLASLYRRELDSLRQGRTFLVLPLSLPKELPSGTQLLRVRVERDGIPLAQSERSVSFLWTFWGRALGDLDQAIRQLRYVATQEQMDSVARAPTLSEKRRRFESFWRALDPTPETLRNEAFEQYYDRIAQANRLFRSYTEGWLTDRGMVYVIFGPPLRREQFQSDGRQYERWTYTDREFLFVDYTGFEDYRLLTPLPPNAKYRYRGS